MTDRIYDFLFGWFAAIIIALVLAILAMISALIVKFVWWLI
jgi:hypothetical protein